MDYLIQSTVGDSRPYLDIRIFGKKVRALLDSGASHTVVGDEGLKLLENLPVNIIPANGRWIETADSNKHVVTGHATVPITLEGRTRDLSVLLVPSLKQAVILGVDFWGRMQIVIDIHNKTWEFSPGKTQLATLNFQEGLNSEEHLSTEEKLKLEKFVNEQFKKQDVVLGRTNLVEHFIDTDKARPVKQRYYNMSPHRLQLVNQELDKMLELGVVVPSKSSWSSPVVLLDKPDGSKRFCVDYRLVNAVTKRDAYPLPQVTMILDRLRDARYLSSLDIKSAYWQIPLSAESREKTAFTVPGRGLFEFTVMPFGLHNAPATWQRLIDRVIGADLEPHVFVYLDDIIVVTPTFQRHLEVLGEILHRLRSANLTLNKEKCHLCRSELCYLGYIVDHRGLRVDPQKVEAILKIPVPTNQKTVRQFCGTASWYRRFIPDFSSKMYPLTSLLKKKQKFVWTDEAQRAFEDIRSALVRAPILACPDFGKPFTISCDASGVGLGAVLSQTGESGENAIAYASRTLTKTEQKYSATERECLAVIWAVEKFRPYVEGTHFTVVTDHYSLIWLHNLKDPNGRLARWVLRLQPYSFTLVHRKGKEHVVPDLLSRSTLEDKHGRVSALEKSEGDKWYSKMMGEVQVNGSRYPNWRVKEGILWKRIPNRCHLEDEDLEWKQVVPKQSRSEILFRCHDAATAGHLGSQKTYFRVQMKYYWPKLRQDVAKYVSRCRVCQQMKFDQQRPSGLMGAYRGVCKPWVMISADLLGPFPRSSAGYKYLLVVLDTFTKFPLLFPLREATAAAVAKRLEEDVFLMFGIPSYIICDNGSEFIGKKITQLAEEYKVKLLYNAKRHAQANPTERYNKTLGPMLRAYVGDNHRHWDREIHKLGFALRTAKHESTGYSPAFLNFGRELSAVNDNADIDNSSGQVPEVETASSHGKKLEDLRKLYNTVDKKLRESHAKNAARYNLRRRPLQFEEGSQVWKRNFPQSDAPNYFSAKLAPRYTGPFTIMKKISPVIYQLADEEGKSIGRWHVSDLKPFI